MLNILKSVSSCFSLLFACLLGGNFCAGYDLSEVATADMPEIDQLEKGRGPMVDIYGIYLNLNSIFNHYGTVPSL